MKHLFTSLIILVAVFAKAECVDSVYFNLYSEVDFDKVITKFQISGQDEVTGMQFMISYDPTVVAFDGFESSLPELGLLTNTSAEGQIRFFWSEPSGTNPFTIPDDGVLFEINWLLLASGDPSITFDSTPTFESEFVSSDIQSICINEQSNSLFLEGAHLTGTVFVDDNDDCIYADETTIFAGATVAISNEDMITYRKTNEEGMFSGLLPVGQYTISVLTPNPSWTSCQSIEVNLTEEGETYSENLLLQGNIECPYMEVQISTPRLRRCFDNNYYFVDWTNLGAGTAENAYISIALDDALNFVSVSEPNAFYQESTHSVILDLGDVPSLHSGSFNIRVEVQCDGVELGQTHCTTAYIYPNTPCDTDEQWSGAELEINGECLDGEVKFIITNIGEGAMTEQTGFIVIEDDIMYEHPEFLLLPGEQESFTFDANGSTYTGIISQPEFFHYGEMLSDAIELCGTDENGEASLGFITMFNIENASPHVDEDCTENIGSYDPNDKQAWPKGYSGTDLIENYVSLDYMIRFQNTGTDTAFTIIVKDTLSEFLDLSSLRIGPSSHDFSFSIEDERTLVWRFDNILLPDSTTNEEASNGFVKFSIDQVAGNEDGTIIDNSASIYFDYNEPILTNIVRREIGSNFVQIGVSTIDKDLVEMDIFPNPADEMIMVEHSDDLSDLDYTLTTLNAQKVAQGNLAHNQIDINNVRQGVYILQIIAEDRIVARRKIVVIR